MNVDLLHRKLISAARAQPPSAEVPYAFEQRVMALLRSSPALDVWALWSRALWRAAAPCVGLMLVLSAWSLLSPRPAPPAGDLSQELETTVLAAADQDQPPAELQR